MSVTLVLVSENDRNRHDTMLTEERIAVVRERIAGYHKLNKSSIMFVCSWQQRKPLGLYWFSAKNVKRSINSSVAKGPKCRRIIPDLK